MKKLKFILSLFTLFLATACDKNQLELTNPNDIQEKDFWTNDKQALQGVLGVYDALQGDEIGGLRYFQLDVLTDNMGTNTNSESWLDIRNFAFNSNTARVVNMWRALYTVVNRANVAIDKISAMPATAISDASKAQLLAEAQFLRAFAYHDLTLIYQGVPFYTKPNTTFSEGVAATKGSDIAKAMIEDLTKTVIPNLPLSATDGRITKGAATFLLGKFYMDLNDWTNAVATLKSLKSAPYSYSLFNDYEKLFTPEVEFQNSEVMFHVNFIDSPLDNGGNFAIRIDTLTTPSVTPFNVPRNSFQITNGLRDSYLCTDGKPFAVTGTAPHPIYGAKSTLASTKFEIQNGTCAPFSDGVSSLGKGTDSNFSEVMSAIHYGAIKPLEFRFEEAVEQLIAWNNPSYFALDKIRLQQNRNCPTIPISMILEW